MRSKIYKSRAHAFTLSEVLLVLSVIGVVAALTIPTLLQKTGDTQNVARLKKVYTTLSQATNLIANDNGGDISTAFASNGTAADNANVMNAFAQKLNIIKNCGSAAGAGCFPSGITYKQLNGNTWVNLDNDALNSKAILADGNIIYLSDYIGICSSSSGAAGYPLANSICGHLGVDINGANGPNQIGRDIFTFWITKSGLYPLGAFNDGRDCSTIGDGCTAKVLTEGAINY